MKRYLVGIITIGLVTGGILGYHAPYWITILVIFCLVISSAFILRILEAKGLLFTGKKKK